MKAIVLITGVCMLLLSAPNARAQQAGTVQPKSKSTALVLSLFSTLVPMVVGDKLHDGNQVQGSRRNVLGYCVSFSGILIGPGAGHLYAGNYDACTSGIVLRGAASGVFIVAAANSDLFDDNDIPEFIVGLGLVAIVYSAVHDIRTAPQSAEQYNQQHGLSGLSMQPYYSANAHGLGLALNLRF
jgi:hypothetical protein